jgi:hypothetical protein
MKAKLLEIYQYIGDIGGNSSDSKEGHAHKKAFTLIAFLKFLACFIWAAMYAAFGLTTAALFPSALAVIIIASILLYAKTKNYAHFVNILLFFMLFVPTLVQWNLGGVAPSGMVMMWSFLSPLGALVFLDSRQAKMWFAGFALLLIASIGLEPFLLKPEPRPFWMIATFIVMNFGVVAAIVFSTIVYFVNQTAREHERPSRELFLPRCH